MRIAKSSGYEFFYSDGRLVRQLWADGEVLDFLYDESGLAYSFVYNGTQYYYVKNLQGDVVAIANAAGSIVVNYAYDAWGNVLSMADISGNDIGTINPIRYRSYYYDTDTGFYYLQSRYYDPAVRRFINADGYVNANGDFLGFNMFAYCSNNPVMYVDYSGSIAIADDLLFWGLVYIASVIATYSIVRVVDVLVQETAGAITKVVEETEAKIKEKIDSIDKSHKKTYSVYFLQDADGKIQYVGRVTDDGYDARMRYHEKTKGLTPQLRVPGLTYTQARGLEEVGMIACHTLKRTPPNNIIHGISPRNKNRIYYLESALEYLLNRAEETLLNMLNY